MFRDDAEAFLVEAIRKLPVSFPTSRYPGEEGINPAYSDIEHCEPLCLDEKRIWALRSDMVLATGIKNAYLAEGNTSLYRKIDKRWHHWVDNNNRYGHPSLLVPDEHYDGSVYYAGWICQRQDHLQVYLLAGRFLNLQLTLAQKEILERYLTKKFAQALGEQEVRFYDWICPEYADRFLAGPFGKERVGRVYRDALVNVASDKEIPSP